MPSQKDEDKKDATQSGWSQFTTQKVKMVSDLFSPKNALKGKLRHYDVIIYNRMESPILWTEISPDHSQSGSNRAIPAEYVHSVLEVKSTCNATTIADAFKKLNELAPFLLKTDAPDEPYKHHILPNFYMGMVFFELPKSAQKNLELLNKLMPANLLRGFSGGIILSGENLEQRNTGRFYYLSGNEPLSLAKTPGRTLAFTGGDIWSDSKETSPGIHTACMFGWSLNNFSLFAFELIGIMNGTYRPGFISSTHGLSFMLEPK